MKVSISEANDLKELCQDELLHAASSAFYKLGNGYLDLKGFSEEEVRKELQKQFKRIEKLFGYTPGSWKI